MPPVHRLVTITDSDGREYRSRVEDVGDGTLVFARPLTLPVEHEFAVGQPLLASWPDPDGLVLATVTLIQTRAREHLGLWVTAVEDLRRQQRRQYVRVPALGPIELRPTEPVVADGVAGQLLDVSEAALRCALRAADAQAAASAPALLASFTLADTRFAVPATMLRAEPSRKDDQLAECVLTFDIDEREAAELRRRVFAEQLRLRRARTAAAF
jgi:c-di-GMP-binding flagellar brake protein YcgR